MNPVARLLMMVVGLVLLLHITPSWGGPPNPTASDANGNTAGGTDALLNVGSSGNCSDTAGCSNTAFGWAALKFDTTGSNNTATGVFALFSNTTGGANTATGVQALHGNTTGGDNTATGINALFSNTTGHYNTATGENAMFTNTTGDYNTASGLRALYGNQTGGSNTATGVSALVNNTTGNYNTASGVNALLTNTTGNKNTGVGSEALFSSTGNKNIALGFKAGNTLTSGNNNIYIGNPGNGEESKTTRLGNVQTRTFVAGIATAGVSGAAVEIDTMTGQLGIAPSSARYKRDIEPMGTRSEKALQLRPVTFAYKDDAQSTRHYGLIAEEVATVYPELVTRTPTGEVQTVRYQELIPMLLNELQRQRQALETQERELAALRALVGHGAEAVTPGTSVAASGTGSVPR